MKQLLFVSILLVSLTVSAQPKIGSQAPEIILKDVNGNAVSLSSLKGKVVLVDFWASWCGPCRRANKHLVNLYPSLKAKGFEIYSISLDDEKADWKKAIAADKITWLQVNEPGSFYAPVATLWNIEQLPTSYLIDKDGKIIARDLEGRELDSKVKRLMNANRKIN